MKVPMSPSHDDGCSLVPSPPDDASTQFAKKTSSVHWKVLHREIWPKVILLARARLPHLISGRPAHENWSVLRRGNVSLSS